jgi:GxxExxY protein
MNELLFENETYAVRGAVFEVYSEMGSGFLEAVYQECLEKEFTIRGIPYVAQAVLRLAYKGDPLVQTYKPDFLCFGKIIVDLKAVKQLAPDHKAQLLNYLKITRLRLGLLVNFGSYPKAEIERMVL